MSATNQKFLTVDCDPRGTAKTLKRLHWLPVFNVVIANIVLSENAI